jgi:membrane fusion protein (multidrug efflux system)
MSGCTPSATATPIPTPALISDNLEVSSVQASAHVVPVQESRLSFTIPGSIKELTIQKGDTVEAGQILATLGAPDLEYGLLEAEAAVRVAEFDYQYWKLPRRVGGRVVERGDVAEQELEVARRELDTARAALIQAEIVAPFKATVVSIEAQSGEFVQAGQFVIILARFDDLILETTDLSELYVDAVEIGQSATVYVEALEENFSGVVTAISPIFDTLGGDVVYTVTIELDELPKDLLWGMSADVEINTEQ